MVTNQNIKKIGSDLSRSEAVSSLSENDEILEGRIAESEVSKVELDALYDDLNLSRKFTRQTALGHTASTYTNWAHLRAESGYGIWSYPVTDFTHNTSNKLLFNDREVDYKGQATSESISTFTKVLDVLDGLCTDVTTEAGTEGGTAFCFMQSASTSSYLLICGSSTYSGIDFDLETLGSNYSLKFGYWNGACYYIYDSACTLSGWDDNTENFHYNGRIEFTVPSNWVEYQVDGTSGYWSKLYTANTPTVTAKAYHILPGDSVPTLLSMTEEDILNEDWKWCYYNDKVYVTIRNAGDMYYVGNLFIKSSSSTETLSNFYINNNIYELSYADSDYSNTSWTPDILCINSGTRNSILQSTGIAVGQIKMCTDAGVVGNLGSLCVWGPGATWLVFYPSCNLVAI